MTNQVNEQVQKVNTTEEFFASFDIRDIDLKNLKASLKRVPHGSWGDSAAEAYDKGSDAVVFTLEGEDGIIQLECQSSEYDGEARKTKRVIDELGALLAVEGELTEDQFDQYKENLLSLKKVQKDAVKKVGKLESEHTKKERQKVWNERNQKIEASIGQLKKSIMSPIKTIVSKIESAKKTKELRELNEKRKTSNRGMKQ